MLAKGRAGRKILILSRRCPLTSSGPQPKIQGFQHTAPGYSGARRPRRALVTEGTVLRHRGEASVVSSPYSYPLGSPLLVGQSLSATRKAVGLLTPTAFPFPTPYRK